MDKLRVIVIDNDQTIRDGCQRVLEEDGHAVATAEDGIQGVDLLKTSSFDLALIDFKMPGLDGLQVLKQLKKLSPKTEAVMITAYASVETAVKAMRLGAYDYIAKPFAPNEIRNVVAKISEKKLLLGDDIEEEWKIELDGRTDILIGDSPRMREVFKLVKKVAPTDSTILIYGESGTGKELIARAIHYNSLRMNKTFMTVDCGSLVDTLFESELFGHEKGAFTGAVATKHGSLELAHGGTFFFDEIGNISLNLQAKILRAIQEREIRRVGSSKTIKIDVRVIAATNRDLRRSVEEGTFREDLFYRLSVIPIYLPSLEERKEDVLPLTEHFIAKYNKRRKREILGISKAAKNMLLEYKWPGNVRELENVVERAVIIEESNEITPVSLPIHVQKERTAAAAGDFEIQRLDQIEKEHIIKTLQAVKWNKSKTAKLLGIDRKTLYDKILRYGIKEP